MRLDLRRKLTKANILKYVSEYEIFSKYVGDFELGKLILSPLPGRKDTSPSFNVYLTPTGRLHYKDFGHSTGDCFEFVALMFYTNFDGALRVIDRDFQLGLSDGTSLVATVERTPLTHPTIVPKERKDIRVVTQAFTPADIIWWGQYGVSIETLFRFNVRSCAEVYLNERRIKYYKPSDPIYSYRFGDRYKIYQPLAPREFKWLFNGTRDIVEGFEQLPESGDLLVITKSLKDVMAYYELGVNAISLPGEASQLPKQKFEELSQRFSRIVLNYDNDTAGRKYATVLQEKYSLESVFVQGAKDLSDLIKRIGKDKTTFYVYEQLLSIP